MSRTQRDIASAGDDCRRGVRFDSRRGCRYDIEVISFDSSDYDRKILRGNMGVPNGDRRRYRQQSNRENLRPSGQVLSRVR